MEKKPSQMLTKDVKELFDGPEKQAASSHGSGVVAALRELAIFQLRMHKELIQAIQNSQQD